MGIKNLTAHLRKTAPHVFREVPELASFCAGKRLVMDVSVFMYKFAYFKDEADVTGEFLGAFLKQHDNLCKAGAASVVYVFDGGNAATGAKKAELDKRRERRAKTMADVSQKIADLESAAAAASVAADAAEKAADNNASSSRILEQGEELVTAIQKQKRRVLSVPGWYYATLRELLALNSVAWVNAVGEAEKCMAWMCTQGHADVAVTEDIDALVCGAPVVLRGLGTAGEHAQASLHELRLSDVLQALQLASLPELVDFGILCGCDFSCKLPQIGPVNALKLMHAWHSIEGIMENNAEARAALALVVESFTYVAARDAFLSAEPQCLS